MLAAGIAMSAGCYTYRDVSLRVTERDSAESAGRILIDVGYSYPGLFKPQNAHVITDSDGVATIRIALRRGRYSWLLVNGVERYELDSNLDLTWQYTLPLDTKQAKGLKVM